MASGITLTLLCAIITRQIVDCDLTLLVSRRAAVVNVINSVSLFISHNRGTIALIRDQNRAIRANMVNECELVRVLARNLAFLI